MRAPTRWSLALSTLALLLSCAESAESPRASAPPPSIEPPAPPARPVGWPYWSAVAVRPASRFPPISLPLEAKAVEKLGGAEARWRALDAATQAELLATGIATVAGTGTRSFAIGERYLAQQCEDLPSLLTVDALMAVVFLVVEAALADAESLVSMRAMRTLLGRFDARLSSAEPGAHPDLLAGLHVAEGVVAVGLSLLDATYRAPDEVKPVVASELLLVRAHAGISMSPLLGVPLDYSVFARRGAVTDATLAPYLAAQWLASASFAFGADEQTSRVDMSKARARSRGALLISRLALPSATDVTARDALAQLDRLGELHLGRAYSDDGRTGWVCPYQVVT